MVHQPHLDLKHIIDVLKSENSTCWVHWQKTKLYDIDPWEFQSFAKQDLEEDSERGRINALSNAKRAIECRVDELLTLFNFKCFSALHRWGLPYKMRILKTFGISAPNILLDYIAQKRNLLEHEYFKPKDPEETRYVADLAELFLSATDKYIEKGYISAVTASHVEEGQRQKISTTWDRRIDYENRYELAFDLKNDALTVTHQEFEVANEYHRKGIEVRSREKAIGEQSVSNIAIRNCKEADVRELMKLIREKAD